MTVTNLTALIFAMGRQGGTIHQVATDLGLKSEEILNADEEKMEDYLRMAQRLNNLNNFRYRSNPNLDGLEEAIKFLDNSPALTDWTTPAKCAVSRCLDAAKLYLKRMEN